MPQIAPFGYTEIAEPVDERGSFGESTPLRCMHYWPITFCRRRRARPAEAVVDAAHVADAASVGKSEMGTNR